MKIIYFVYLEYVEAEGMFTEDETLIDAWACNDAHCKTGC